MSNWNSMQIGNQCNSLRNNAVHHRFGFHLTLHSTGNRTIYAISPPTRDRTYLYMRPFLFDIETGVNDSRALDPHLAFRCSFECAAKFVCYLYLCRFMLDNYHCTMKRLALRLPNKPPPRKS